MQSDNPWSAPQPPVPVLLSTRLPDNESNTIANIWVDPEHLEREDTEYQTTRVGFWDRLTGEGRPTVGVKRSIISLVTYSWLNVFLVIVPLAWALHFMPNISHKVTFAVSMIALLPLVKLLHYVGDQMALNCGKVAGDFIMITVNNSVETVTAILLLLKCELKLLQSTITGFFLLRLLLVSGTAFITGGLRRGSQTLRAQQSQMNQTMLTTGAFALLLPALFYNALDQNPHLLPGAVYAPNVVNHALRRQILDVSRALSPLLLIAYVCSCCYVHYPPGCEDVVFSEKDPEACLEPQEKDEKKPEVNFWASFIVMIIVSALMVLTAECLISSIQPMKTRVREEWFGLVLIPLVSYAADGVLATVYFIRSLFREWLGEPYKPTGSLAETRAIDLSIQFMLLWTPVLVLIGWMLSKPMSLLFDLFEIVLIIIACILLNSVTFDSKTNWAEGVMLVVFYFMIVITAWFYPGRQDVRDMLMCNMLSNETLLVQAPSSLATIHSLGL